MTEIWNTKANETFAPEILFLQGYKKYDVISGSSRKRLCDCFLYINRTELDKQHKGNNSEFELKWIEVVSTKRDNVVVRWLYRYTRPKDKHFLNHLRETYKKHKEDKKSVIMTSDFNLNLLNFEKNKQAEEFLQYFTSQWLNPQVIGSTRVSQYEKQSLLDNFFINFHELNCANGISLKE